MSKKLQELPPHPVRSLLPPLGVMETLGFSSQRCLKGSGILLSQLEDPQAAMSLRQELAFYRNTLELSADPTIGLRLGEPFLPQRYGLFGYALLSAPTFRHALSLTRNFGKLTFSFFTFDFGAAGSRAWWSMSEPPPFEQRLVDLYVDRDMSAACVGFAEILGFPLQPHEVWLMHDGHGMEQVYREYFGCEVTFGADCGKLVFPSQHLEERLPQSDPESSQHFLQQCQMLIAKMTSQSHFIDDVRMLILARPGFFPDIELVADKLGMSVRTLRRRLREEGSGYRQLLDEIRFGLAREYLGNTNLPIEEITILLGYSEAGNFSHAFRRWSGESPSSWRSTHAGEAV